jgi:beta-glucosidase-like glycosyl hydrolase/CubicO group peptidase (beta-lactamase class C family)
LIKDHGIGGMIFFKGGPKRQANLTNEYQTASKVPLMLSIDGEWGLAMRLDSTTRFPRQMLLGAIQDNELIYQMGKEIGEQCKRIGLHVNFAPVVDVNNNPNNPVIGSRSFGELPMNVAMKGEAYMRGLQDAGILANAKHFPGHGDTDSDSHKSLPVVSHTKERLDSLELIPFKYLFERGLGSVMVAHLFVPNIDSTKNQASTLSKKFVTEMLKEELGFKGLVFTDALNMKGVAKYYAPGEVDLKAFLAGNDVMLFAENVPLAIQKIKQAVTDGTIEMAELDRRCKKVLLAKEWTGVHKKKLVDLDHLYSAVKTKNGEALNYTLAENALTVVKNDSMLPLIDVNKKIAYLNIGGPSGNSFYRSMKKYANITQVKMSKTTSASGQQAMIKKLKAYDLVIVGMHKPSRSPKSNFGMSFTSIEFIKELGKNVPTVNVMFANPYAGKNFDDLSTLKGFVVAYEDTKYTRDRAGQLLFGATNGTGKLPVSMNETFKAGYGVDLKKKIRLKYVQPIEVGIDEKALDQIDSIAVSGIREKAYPGCQVIAVKDGHVFYQKSFGHLTYDNKHLVTDSTIYDIASITKIVASTASLMKLTSEGKMDITKTLHDYIPELVDSTRYEKMVIKEMLAHQAGLHPWIPFYFKTLYKGQPYYKYYSTDSTANYKTRIADDLFLKGDFRDTILNRILAKKLRRKTYKYSDLGYYFIKEIIEKVSEQKMEDYVAESFYKPLGLNTMGYKPKFHVVDSLIAPTENDTVFRNQVVQGYVHDMGAALLGGVGGHAGVFGSGNDLAVFMQMLLDYGQYGGQQYIDTNVVKSFTARQFPKNRRGAGFDRPVTSLEGGPTCNRVSHQSFGHTGFTGTMVWSDPKHGINYVFLSNRTFPDMENRKILKLDIRTKIQAAVYDAAKTFKTTL